jgi:hypothetical protein
MSTHDAPWPPPPPHYGGPPAPYAPASPRLGKAVIAALIMAALGFAEISFWSSRSVNGVMVECDYTNLAPIIFGPLAVILGLVAVLKARANPQAASRARQLGMLALALGALHLLRAAGVVELDLFGGGSPC